MFPELVVVEQGVHHFFDRPDISLIGTPVHLEQHRLPETARGQAVGIGVDAARGSGNVERCAEWVACRRKVLDVVGRGHIEMHEDQLREK
ncbi:Uncharacterised protein [Mycobacteroides abscessus subsp. abscessus]|nr:Uncharacterised protein [Mycobacteroides abscessus subsp. abscessus]